MKRVRLLGMTFATFLLAFIVYMWIRSYTKCDSVLLHTEAETAKQITETLIQSNSGYLSIERRVIQFDLDTGYQLWMSNPRMHGYSDHLEVKTYGANPIGYHSTDASILREWDLDHEIIHFSTDFSEYGTKGRGRGLQHVVGWRQLIGYWILAAVVGLPVTIYWLRKCKAWFKRPWPAGHCQQCGYDLRASVERCPECGKSI